MEDRVAKWERTGDGWRFSAAEITDNGAGLGSARGSGRWAVVIAGTWIANIDYLADAKKLALSEMENA
jgi:hypothetical protein